MRNEKVEEECIRYLSKEGSEEERFLFELELSINDDLKKNYVIYRKIWEAYPLDFEEKRNGQKTVSEPNPFKSKFRRVKVFLTIAASLLMGWFLFENFYDAYPNRVATQARERVTFYLPDSTKVILNSQSSLSYCKDFLKNRNVNLQGEAFFEVVHRKGQPFKVFSEDIEVLVLGTKFNVNTSDSLRTVALEEGKVSMRIPESGMNVTLLPNELVVYDPENKHLDKRWFDPKVTLVWKDDVLVLEDIALQKALPKINNYYGVEFILNDSIAGTKSIKGVFKGKDVDEFKDAMEFITGFTIENVEEQTYLIQNK